MQRDYWYSVARTLSKLDAPEKVGKIAAERTLRRLGARKAKTAQVPIVFDPMVSTSILEHIFDYSFDPQTNVVDVLVHRLRSKVDKGRAMIHTIRGVGYVLRPA